MRVSVVVALAVFVALTFVSVSAGPTPPPAPIITVGEGCPPGQDLQGYPKKCVECAAGRFKNNFGQQACSACAAGFSTTGLTGQTACTDCLPGTYTGDVGRPKCIPCSRGYYNDLKTQKICKQCITGQFCANEGMTAPEFCPVGTYTTTATNENPGYRACLNCWPGRFGPKVGGKECPTCAAGEWSPTTSEQCWPCPAGTYSKVGSSACTQCEYGFFAATEKSPACTQCPADTYQSFVGSKECLPCPAGQKAAAGAGICSPDGSIATTKAVSLVESESEILPSASKGTEDKITIPKPKVKKTKVAPKAPIIPAKNGNHPSTKGSAYRGKAGVNQRAQTKDVNGRHHALGNGRFQKETRTNSNGQLYDRRTGQFKAKKPAKKVAKKSTLTPA